MDIAKYSIKNIEELENNVLKGFSIIAVTGGMASGKNYVCSKLEAYGWKSIDADLVVHEAIDKAAEEIFTTFESDAKKHGLKIRNSDNTVNRRELGKLLFLDNSYLKKQEKLVYPMVIANIKEFCSKNPKTIINATVLYKTQVLLELCDSIIFVTANKLKRFIRARKRDNLSYKQIKNRFKAQKNLKQEYLKTGKPVIFVKN